MSGTYCLDAVVTIVNAENTAVTDLSAAQIKAISPVKQQSGKIFNKRKVLKDAKRWQGIFLNDRM